MNSVIYEIPIMSAYDNKRIYGDGSNVMGNVTLEKVKVISLI